MAEVSFYNLALQIAREERGLVAYAQKNSVDFEIDGKVIGLVFRSVNGGIRADAAMLAVATSQMIETVHHEI